MGKLYYQDKPIIGLDISQTGIKVMAINAKKWLVTGYGTIDLDPAKVTASLESDDDYLETSLRTLLSKNILGHLPSTHTVLSVPTGRTFTRTFQAPLEAEKHLKDAISLEIDQYIPLPETSLYVDQEITERDKESITVSMSAAPRKLIDRLTSITENAGLEVCAVEPSISAVARVLRNTEEGHLPTVIVDIGPASTDIAVLDGSIKVTGSVAIGGNTFTLDIAKKLKIPLENAHQLKVLNGLNAGARQQKLRGALTPSLERILNETRKVMRYYTERLENSKKLEQVLIVGGGSNVPGVGDYFTNALVMPARVASPWQRLNFGSLDGPAKQFRPRYITVAGLASVDPQEVWE
ncbi:MAG TPA: pilus assembly protein PilM [Candidatus Saccharimonadales bacterium]